MMQCSRTYFAISGLILWVLMGIGCEGNGGAWPKVADIFQPDEIVEANPTWPYWPEKMRIHPLTRVVAGETEGSLFIEARLELLDPDDIPTRGKGQVGFELVTETYQAIGNAPLAWEMDLRDLSNNRQHFDEITQTYLFRLELEWSQFPEDAELRAYFLRADGQALRDRRQLTVPNE